MRSCSASTLLTTAVRFTPLVVTRAPSMETLRFAINLLEAPRQDAGRHPQLGGFSVRRAARAVMNLTIDYPCPERPISHAAAAAVIAAAVRVGHTVTLIAGPARVSFTVDDDRGAVIADRPDPLDGVDPASWAQRLATTATRLLWHHQRRPQPRSGTVDN
jgi:hypothetical protein